MNTATASTAAPASADTSSTSVDFKQLPIVDLSPMFGDDVAAKQALASHIYDVCTNVGFFYLEGHGVPQDKIDEIFAIGKNFMMLPEEEKMKISIDKHPNKYAGYSPLRSRSNALFCGFDMTVEFAEDDPAVLAGYLKPCKNPWPDEYPAFERAMKEYRKLMLDLGHRLFSAFALSLNLPEDHFHSITHEPFGSLRVNYYPPQDPLTKDDDVGIYAHTDFQCFTLLAQDAVAGLQVQNGVGEWIGAPPVRGTFVINIGDMLARWTNDIFKSTPHRVLNLSGEERMSVPFFFGTDFMAIIDTLPSCISAERPKHYAPVMSGKHVLDRFESYKDKGRRDDPRPTV